MGLEGLEPPPNKNIASPNEMKPISPFGLGLMFFCSNLGLINFGSNFSLN